MDSWSEFWNAVQALAVVVTVGIAFAGLKTWRQQLVGGKKFEIAEATLMTVYQIRVAIKQIRNPFIFSGEIEEALSGFDNSPSSQERGAASYRVTFNRMRPYEKLFAELETRRVQCKVHFQADSAPFLALNAILVRDIALSANFLVEDALDPTGWGSDDDRNKNVKGWKENIWERPGEDDPITLRVGENIEKIEKICRQHLK